MDKSKIIISKRGKIPLYLWLLLCACFLIPIFLRDGYLLHICVVLAITGALTTNFNLAAGYAGQTSFAHSAFYGVGAYIVAILGTRYGISMWVCMRLLL